MNRKYIILIVAAVLLVVVLMVFWLTRPKKPTAITQLSWVTYNEEEKNFTDIISAFEKQNNVKINFIKKDLSNYEVDSLNSISTGKIDIWGIPNNWLPKHQDKLAYLSGKSSKNQDYVETYKSLYPEIVVSENIQDNKIYGYPLSFDPLVLFINSQAANRKFSDQNPTEKEREILTRSPSNWDDVALQAQVVTKKNGAEIDTSGLALGTTELADFSDILTLLMLQDGTQMTSEDKTQATFHTALNKFGGVDFPGTKALDFYASFAEPNSVNYSYSNDFGDGIRAFAEGKIYYLVAYASKAKEFKLINPKVEYQTSALPQVNETKNPVTWISYETFGVPKSSPNQSVAWKFLDFLTQNAKVYYSASQSNPLTVDQLDDKDSSLQYSVKYAGSWYNPDVIESKKIFSEAVSQVLGGKSAQTVLDGAAQQVTQLLKNLKE